jgi:CelD/BcsL family acetyltransferase involved in cellulose biosynthesis
MRRIRQYEGCRSFSNTWFRTVSLVPEQDIPRNAPEALGAGNPQITSSSNYPRDPSSLPESSRCDVKVTTDEAELNRLEPQWNLLLDQSDATVFQSFEWVSSCWKYFGKSSELHCLSFHVGDRLVGLGPFCRRVIRFPFRLCTVLEFIGRPHGDYNDLIVAPGFGQIVVRAFVHHFSSGDAEADVLDLDEIPPSSSLAAHLINEARNVGIDAIQQRGVVCPYIALPPSFEAFLSSLGPNTRYNFKRKWRNLSESHAVSERMIRHTDDTISEGLDSFIRIHTERWKGLGFPSLYENPALRDFINEVSRKFARRDWLRLYLLSADGLDVAASLEFAHRGRVYMYNSNAAGPPDVMKHSPGLLIKFSAIKQSISEQMREYDMLRGEEGYKSDNLKASERFNSTFRLARSGSSGKIRSRLYLSWLLQKKVVGRTRLEYHEWRRFSITRHPGFIQSAGYFGRRVGKVSGMLSDFLGASLGRGKKSAATGQPTTEAKESAETKAH